MNGAILQPKVLLLGAGLAGGGGEIHFRGIAERLYAGQADTLTLLPIPPDMASPVGGAVRCLGWKSELSYPRIILSIRHQILRKQYDVVLGFGTHSNILIYLATRALARLPRLVMCEISRPTMDVNRHGAKGRTLLWLLRRANAFADAVAANSIDGADECITFLNAQQQRTVRIPNLVEAAVLRKRASEPLTAAWPRHPHVLVTCARLVAMKRVDTLIHSIAALCKDYDCGLIVLGDGPQHAELAQLANQLGVGERVYFHGWQANPLPFVARASACVLASEYEGFSNTILEAMFLDVPVVTSTCTSDARAMCARRAALGFQPGDAAGLTAALATVFSSNEVRSELLQNAARYRTPHEIANAIGWYEKLLTNVAAGAELPRELQQFDLGMIDGDPS